MHCNGKCHLKKQLDKEDKKQQSLPGSSKEKSEVQFFSDATFPELAIANSEVIPHFNYCFYYPDAPAFSIFHPPLI